MPSVVRLCGKLGSFVIIGLLFYPQGIGSVIVSMAGIYPNSTNDHQAFADELMLFSEYHLLNLQSL